MVPSPGPEKDRPNHSQAEDLDREDLLYDEEDEDSDDSLAQSMMKAKSFTRMVYGGVAGLMVVLVVFLVVLFYILFYHN